MFNDSFSLFRQLCKNRLNKEISIDTLNPPKIPPNFEILNIKSISRKIIQMKLEA